MASLQAAPELRLPNEPLTANIYYALVNQMTPDEYMNEFLENAKRDPVLAKKYKAKIEVYNKIVELETERVKKY